MIEVLTVGKIYKIEYKDAFYTYKDISSDNVENPPLIISIGIIRRVTDQFVDISILWSGKKKFTYKKGIIIPKQALVSLKELYE